MSLSHLCLCSSVLVCIILAVLLCFMLAFCKWAAILQFSFWPNPIFPYKAHGWIMANPLSSSCHVPAGQVMPSSPAPPSCTTCCSMAKCLQICVSALVALLVLHLVALEVGVLGVIDVSTWGNKTNRTVIWPGIKMGALPMLAASGNPVQNTLWEMSRVLLVTSLRIAQRSSPLIWCHTFIHSRLVSTSWPAPITTGNWASPVLSVYSWKDWMKMVVVAWGASGSWGRWRKMSGVLEISLSSRLITFR